MYAARVEKDSIAPNGHRLTTFVITFPRVVLAETVTHRLNYDMWGGLSFCERTTTVDVSKNSASSRAIPFSKMLERVKEDPYMPTWTLNQKGMQGEKAEDTDTIRQANWLWLEARDRMIGYVQSLANIGIHKQDCNRLLEPWAWVTQIVTSSRWDNFFALRCHHAAHPAFRHVARMLYLTRRKSTPRRLVFGQWHLPFVSDGASENFTWHPEYGKTYDPRYHESVEGIPELIKYSAARCAWVSYENHDKDGTPEAMLGTWKRLFAEIPIHASPVEHQATPLPAGSYIESPGMWRSNLYGWVQARKLLKHEEIREYNPSEEEIASWGLEV